MKTYFFTYRQNGEFIRGEFEFSGLRSQALLALLRFQKTLPLSARFTIQPTDRRFQNRF